MVTLILGVETNITQRTKGELFDFVNMERAQVTKQSHYTSIYARHSGKDTERE